VKSNRALFAASIILSELQGRVITANASTNASKSLALLIVAWTTTKTVSITKLDLRSIRKGGSQYWLVVEGGLAGDRERNTRVALEDDVAGPLLELLGAASTEREDKAARVVLGPGGNVKLGKSALVTRGNLGLLSCRNGFVGVFLGDDLQEGRAECLGRKLASRGDGLDSRACLFSTKDQGRICGGGDRKREERSKNSERLHFEYSELAIVQMKGYLD
jgi:hypothetical protein